ncbi:translation machinery-associated protein 16 [Coemansia nantahalensis]|uniref:Translation machinery-associated protein 16 n=1 Tax=Coemansia nantahalensis TaxID=2789366 RepID=A0ACC1K7C8_9FUNG|nr:translation machinery-associated protein 16 [Coemansia nantahalensis]KAJ2775220.1 translation machinery-associated protein 16 [Coemansia nantahalensis]
MPNNKRKRVAKIKGKDKAHPYSRKAQQISRAMKKEASLAQAKSARTTAAMGRGQRLVWFRDRLNEDDLKEQKAWTKTELAALVAEYLRRNDAEIEALEAKAAGGRALALRESLLVQNDKAERNEARIGGIDVPDVTNAALVRTLRAWDGDLNSTTTIKLIRCQPPAAAAPPDSAAQDGGADSEAESEDAAIARATGMTVA